MMQLTVCQPEIICCVKWNGIASFTVKRQSMALIAFGLSGSPHPPKKLCSIVILVGILKSICSKSFSICCVLIIYRSCHLRVSNIFTSSPLFWFVKPRICMVIYWRFGTTYQVPSRVKQSKKNTSFAERLCRSVSLSYCLFLIGKNIRRGNFSSHINPLYTYIHTYIHTYI
jgi:hypothetical protein